jgi:hypothetical protein
MYLQNHLQSFLTLYVAKPYTKNNVFCASTIGVFPMSTTKKCKTSPSHKAECYFKQQEAISQSGTCTVYMVCTVHACTWCTVYMVLCVCVPVPYGAAAYFFIHTVLIISSKRVIPAPEIPSTTSKDLCSGYVCTYRPCTMPYPHPFTEILLLYLRGV